MNISTTIRSTILIIIAFSLAACTGSAEDVNNVFDPDLISNEVKFTSTPTNQQKSVSTNLQRISISFDRAINIDSINEGNLTIYPAITGTIDKTYMASQNTVHLILQETLTVNTSYVASISGVLDAKGKALDTYTWSFETESDTPVGNQDLIAPSTPDNLRIATGSLTSSSVRLMWDASTDNIGVVGYRIMRGNTLFATTVNTDLTDMSITAGTTYQYSIVAYDAANNFSTSSTITASAPALADTTPPSTPGNLRTAANSPTSSSVQLQWDPSTDDIGVTGYRIMRGNTLLDTTVNTTFTDMNVVAATTYQYSIAAYDAANNFTASNTISVSTPALADTTAPSAPGNLRTATGSPTDSSVQLIWNTSLDDIAVTGYRVMRDNTILTTTTNTTFTDLNLTPGSTYQYSIIAVDAANNSTQSSQLSVTTLNTVVTGIATLSWSEPTLNTDNSSLDNLDSYKIYYGLSPSALNNTIIISDTNTTSYVFENLSINTTYYFSITAINNQNRESSYSNIVSKDT